MCRLTGKRRCGRQRKRRSHSRSARRKRNLMSNKPAGWLVGHYLKLPDGTKRPTRYDFRAVEGRRADPLIRVYPGSNEEGFTELHHVIGAESSFDLNEAKRIAIAHSINIHAA